MPSWIAELVRRDGDGSSFRTSAAFGVGRRLYGGSIAAQVLAAAPVVTRLPERWADHFEVRVAPGGSPEWPDQPFW